MSSLIPGNITFLDIEDIYGPPSNNPRQNYSEEGMEELINSLKAQGQLRPVVGRIRCEHDPADSEGFKVVLEDGHSRLEARRQGTYERDGKNIRREDIKVLIAPSIEMRAQELFDEKFPDGIEDVEELSKQLSFCVEEIKSSIARESHAVNTIREKWDVYGEAVSLDSQIKMQEVLSPDLSRDELMQKVADANGTRVDTLRIRLSLLDESKTPKDIQEALKKGELSQSQALVLRRISSEDIRRDLVDRTYTDDLSVAAINKEIKKLEKKAESEGKDPVVSGKRKSRKKDSSQRDEEYILAAISDLQGVLESTDPDSEPDEYERAIGAIAALQWIMTPESEEDIHLVISTTAERIYAESREDSEDFDDSEDLDPSDD